MTENMNKTNLTEANVQENLTEENTKENLKEGDTQEILPEEDLEKVAGGTVNEYAELLSALSKNPNLQKWGNIAGHLPGGNLVAANASDGIKGILKGMDIKVDLSLGLGGTGLFSTNNKYTRISTGEPLTHAEVISILKSTYN